MAMSVMVIITTTTIGGRVDHTDWQKFVGSSRGSGDYHCRPLVCTQAKHTFWSQEKGENGDILINCYHGEREIVGISTYSTTAVLLLLLLLLIGDDLSVCLFSSDRQQQQQHC